MRGRQRQAGKGDGGRACVRALPVALIVLFLAAAPACNTAKPGGATAPPKKEQDPLFGPEPKKVADAGNTQTKSVPPVPEYQPTMSTAAMAAALPLEGAKPALAIPNEQANPGAATGWTGPNTPPAKPNAALSGGVQPVPAGQYGSKPPAAPTWNVPPITNPDKTAPILGPPQPIMPSPQTSTLPPANNLTLPEVAFAAAHVPAPVTVSYEQLQQELKKRGVLWQRQDKTDSGVRFSCAVPHPHNPSAERQIQTEASDLLTAMQWALAKIDSPVP